MGAVLAGTKEFISQAWRLKQRFGGAMRQSGIIASMCLYALDHHVDRLADDHSLADFLGEEIAKLAKVKTVLPVETNIAIFDMTDDAPTAIELVKMLRAEGVLVGAFGERRVRVVTHLDVDPAAGTHLMKILSGILGGNEKQVARVSV